jgi:hypothetical protein
MKTKAFLDGNRIVKRRIKELSKNWAKKKYTYNYVAVCSLLHLQISVLCRKGPNLKYSGLFLESQILRQYGREIGYPNSVSGEPIR